MGHADCAGKPRVLPNAQHRQEGAFCMEIARDGAAPTKELATKRLHLEGSSRLPSSGLSRSQAYRKSGTRPLRRSTTGKPPSSGFPQRTAKSADGPTREMLRLAKTSKELGAHCAECCEGREREVHGAPGGAFFADASRWPPEADSPRRTMLEARTKPESAATSRGSPAVTSIRHTML